MLTFADLDDRDRRGHSISARLVAELADGTHVVLLDDRGWTSGHGGAAGHTPEEVEMTARMVVGPDEPGRDQTRAEVESDHYPSDLETVLDDYAEIREAAVVGKPDEQLGEVPVAGVVPTPGRTLTTEQVIGLFESQLAPTSTCAR